MCLIAFALGMQPDCPLLLASNRDEFWDRPTLPLSTWTLPSGVTVHAGRDEQAGGTWLGFSDQGRVAMLTNVRSGDIESAPRSRGELVTLWLSGATAAPDWVSLTQTVNPQDYGGFNLVLGNLHNQDWVWLSNHPHTHRPALPALAAPTGWMGAQLLPGVYGLSNATLDTPWPKTCHLKAATVQALNNFAAMKDWRPVLLDALLHRETAADADLPTTGIPLEREKLLSSPFVHMPQARYGTRSSLIAHWQANTGELALEEWTHANEVGASSYATSANATWPLHTSSYRRISMSTWGMPTSS